MDTVTTVSDPERRAACIEAYCKEMARVLRPGASLLQITEEPPDLRLGALGTVYWTPKLAAVLEAEDWPEPYYLYAATRRHEE